MASGLPLMATLPEGVSLPDSDSEQETPEVTSGEPQDGDCLDQLVSGILSKASDTWMLQNISFSPLATPFSNFDLLSGKHIREAFRMSSFSSDECDVFANRVCRRAAAGARQHPVPVLGRFGQGKSSLINSLLRSSGNSSLKRAQTGRYEATTKDVNVYQLPISEEFGEVLLCDTPGWEPEQSSWGLEMQYTSALSEGGYCAENVPDVSIFVVAGTPQGMRELSSAVEGRNLARAFAQIQRRVIHTPLKRKLLPAITFADTVDSEIRKVDEAFLKDALQKVKQAATEDFEVLEPVYISNRTGAGVEDLKKELIENLTSCAAQPAKSRPWFSIMEKDLCAELAKEEAGAAGKSADLFQRSIAALAHLHGQAAVFPPSPWTTIPYLKGKLRGEIAPAERIFGRPGLICLILICILAVVANCFEAALGTVPSLDPERTEVQIHTALGESLPSTFEWDISKLGAGEYLSPLFDRRGVPGMQLNLSCAASLCSLGLLAPDSWEIDFVLHVGTTSKAFSGTFPWKVGGMVSPLGLHHFKDPRPSYHKVSIEVTNVMKMALRMKGTQTFTWDFSHVALHGPVTSPTFAADVVAGLSLEFYPSGGNRLLGGQGDTSAIYLCAPAGSSLMYRLFVDDVSRTMAHRFVDSWWGLFKPPCAGFPDFSFRSESYGKAGVEILRLLEH